MKISEMIELLNAMMHEGGDMEIRFHHDFSGYFKPSDNMNTACRREYWIGNREELEIYSNGVMAVESPVLIKMIRDLCDGPYESSEEAKSNQSSGKLEYYQVIFSVPSDEKYLIITLWDNKGVL